MFDPYNPIPTSVQPYGYGVNPYLRQNPSQTNLPSQPQITTNKIIVSGLEEVKMRMQPANSEIIYLDNEKSLLYQKTVDNTGHFEVKVFDISEHKAPETPAQMQELKEIMIKSICKLNEKDYKETELDLHKVLYGERLGEYLAKKRVSSMENKDSTKGAHWTIDQTESVRKQYAPKADSNDWYAVLNMIYSDYYNPKFETADYVELAKDWIDDKDTGEGKTLKYYYYIASCRK